jgi:FkbM family methyltransferase
MQNQTLFRNTIIAGNIFDEPIVACAKQYITDGSTVLDVGANFGQMSILFSEMTGDRGKVYSFEADDFIFEILKKNIFANTKGNIIPVFGAVYNEMGKNLTFPVQDFERFDTYGSYGIDYANNTKNGREVPTLTIDSLNIDEKISFMKIDVQGGDLFALEGSVNTIKKNKMPILFEFEYLFQDELSLKFQEYVDFVCSIDYYFAKIINYQNYLILPL